MLFFIRSYHLFGYNLGIFDGNNHQKGTIAVSSICINTDLIKLLLLLGILSTLIAIGISMQDAFLHFDWSAYQMRNFCKDIRDATEFYSKYGGNR